MATEDPQIWSLFEKLGGGAVVVAALIFGGFAAGRSGGLHPSWNLIITAVVLAILGVAMFVIGVIGAHRPRRGVMLSPGSRTSIAEDPAGGKDIERVTVERERQTPPAQTAAVGATAHDATVSTSQPGIDAPGVHEARITNPDGTTDRVDRRTYERTEWKYDSDRSQSAESEVVRVLPTARSDHLDLVLEDEERVPVGNPNAGKLIVGVRLRVTNRKSVSQTLRVLKWDIKVPGLHDEAHAGVDPVPAKLEELRAAYPELPEVIPPGDPTIGWLWHPFPTRASGRGRYAYTLHLQDGLSSPYYLSQGEWIPGG